MPATARPCAPSLRGRRILFMLSALTTLAVLASVAGCDGDSAAASGAGQPGRRPGPGGPREQAVPVAVEPAVTGDIASYYKATATLEAEKTTVVLARVTGVVESLAVEEGDEVPADAPLLVVANDEYRLRAQQAAARTANLRSRFERLQAMVKEQLATDEEFEAARSDLASAEADEGLAELDLSYTTVRAPFAGRVTARLVDVGSNLSVGTALFELADFHPLLARVHVPSREFNKLRREQSVDLVLDSSGERLQGRIMLISPVIDPASGTIKITVEVDEYPAGIRPGDFAEVQIVTERRHDAVLVPRGAVLTDKGEKVVFVALPADADSAVTAERRVVETGFIDDVNAQVLEGVAAGESIVVKGQRSLQQGSPLKILDDDGNGR